MASTMKGVWRLIMKSTFQNRRRGLIPGGLNVQLRMKATTSEELCFFRPRSWSIVLLVENSDCSNTG